MFRNWKNCKLVNPASSQEDESEQVLFLFILVDTIQQQSKEHLNYQELKFGSVQIVRIQNVIKGRISRLLLCANAHCKNLLTDFELKRLGVVPFQRTKDKFCITCKRYHLKNIQKLRCLTCENGFSNFKSIFQNVCDNCRVTQKKEVVPIA